MMWCVGEDYFLVGELVQGMQGWFLENYYLFEIGKLVGFFKEVMWVSVMVVYQVEQCCVVMNLVVLVDMGCFIFVYF